MKKIIYTLIFIAVLTGILIVLPTPQDTNSTQDLTQNDTSKPLSDNSFVLTNVTVFDGNTWYEDSQLVVIEGQISNNQNNLSHLPEIDGNQGFVIPGLIDAHTHTWGKALQEALSFGVTTELDMFTQTNFAQQARLNRDSYEKTSQADFYSAGTLVTSTGGHGTEYGFEIPTIDNPEDANQFVLDRIQEGSDYIKIVYHHKPKYHGLTSFSKEVLTAVIKATHMHNKLAVVHISDHQSAVDAVEAGANGLVHTFGDQTISDELLDAMKTKQVFIIPTLSVIASFAQSEHGLELAADENLSKRLSITGKNGLKPFANIPKRPKTLINAIQNTRKMHEYGIVVLAGTDAPNPGTAHGISMHGELALLNRAGLNPTEALQSAGILTKKLFSLGNRGTLTSDAKADFILLSADPRKDIKNTRKITGIWKNGFLTEAQQSPKIKGIKLPTSGLISDFNQKTLTSSFKTDFQTTSDQMMQGNSTADIKWSDSSCNGDVGDAELNGSLQVQGEIKAGFLYAWSGVFLPFSIDMSQTINLESAQSIDWDISGSPGTYQLMIFTMNSMQPAQIPFEITDQCQQVSIDLSAHTNIDWSLVTGLAWAADRSRLKPALASFNFKLDNVVITHE